MLFNRGDQNFGIGVSVFSGRASMILSKKNILLRSFNQSLFGGAFHVKKHSDSGHDHRTG